MIKIEEFRKKYPEYNDYTDYELTKALHNKYYIDKISFKEFAKVFGGPTQETGTTTIAVHAPNERHPDMSIHRDIDTFMQFVPLIILTIILAIPFQKLAKNKGCSGLLQILCYIPLINVFAISFIIGHPDMVARKGIQQLLEQKQLKKCPFCAEYIQQEAILCKHCGRDIPQENRS